ncbi:MAG TPA: IS110 family transposase [Herpetosiphonaceae bacterium]|nr:IS110 family transposase [Herpetosiphonaceae bacterium]
MMETQENHYRLFVGVDIAATTMTVAWQAINLPISAPRTFAQTADGTAALIGDLQRTDVEPVHTLIVMEATGSYWITVATVLHQAGYVVSVVNPAHAHHFARSHGQRAKTDAVDARMLVRLAQERHPPAWTPPPTVYHELRQRLVARDGLIAMRTQARNQRHALQQWPVLVESVMAQLDVVIATVTSQINQLEQEIADVLADGAWARSACLLQSIPGVGVVTAAWLLVSTVNFTVSSTPTALAAYAGLAPMPHESGTSIRGQPRIGHSGNTRLRHALYMATLSASRHNPLIRVFYQRLRDAGKPIKVARCAAARKLLHLAWAVVTKEQGFDPAYR